MLYESKELRGLYKTYLENKMHKGKPYTQTWFAILLLEVESPEELYGRERVLGNFRPLKTVNRNNYYRASVLREEGYSWRIVKERAGVSKYMFERVVLNPNLIV